MDEVDKDVANLLGINPQELEARSSEPPSPKRTRVAPGLGAAMVAVVVTVSLSSLALLQLKPATAPVRSTHVASAQKLDVFLDRPAPRGPVEPDVATGDEPITSPVQLDVKKKMMIPSQSSMRSHHSGHSATLRLARAEFLRRKRSPAIIMSSPPVDNRVESGTVANLGVEKTLVNDRLDAIDSLRLLHQR